MCVHACMYVYCMCLDMYMCVCLYMYICFWVCICSFQILNGDLCVTKNVSENEIHKFIHVLNASLSCRQSWASVSHKQTLIGMGQLSVWISNPQQDLKGTLIVLTVKSIIILWMLIVLSIKPIFLLTDIRLVFVPLVVIQSMRGSSQDVCHGRRKHVYCPQSAYEGERNSHEQVP